MSDFTLVHVKLECCGNKVAKLLLPVTFYQHDFCSCDAEFDISVFDVVYTLFTGFHRYLALLSTGLLRHYRLKSAIGRPVCVKVTSVRRFLSYFARSHQSRCPHRSFFDSQNPLKNRRHYDPEILRKEL